MSDLEVCVRCIVVALRRVRLFGGSTVGPLPVKDFVLACTAPTLTFLAFALEHSVALRVERWIARQHMRRLVSQRHLLGGIDALRR